MLVSTLSKVQKWVDAVWRSTFLPHSKEETQAIIDKLRLALKPGVNDAFKARRLSMIGERLYKQGQYKPALQCAEFVLNSPLRKVGSDSDGILISGMLDLSAQCCIHQQKLKEAEKSLTESLSILQRQKRLDRQSLQTICLLAQVYQSEHLDAKAKSLLLLMVRQARTLHAAHAEANASLQALVA